MKHVRFWAFAALLVGIVAGAHSAQDTDITNRQVRDPLQLETYLEANASDAQTRLAAVEAGGVTALTVTDGAVTVIGASTTTRWDNASSKIDGEAIADDTIDDDSIDFADVTGADLTLTDCTDITASGPITASGGLTATTARVNGDLQLSAGTLDALALSVVVTNGQVVNPWYHVTYVSTTESKGTTNALAAPSGISANTPISWIVNDGTNTLHFLDSGTLAGGAEIELGPTDVMSVIRGSGDTWSVGTVHDN